MKFRDRIKRFDRVPASELAKNPKNWRTHPDSQRRVLRDLLDEIGIVDTAIAYETPDGLVLIDGHLRTEEITDTPIPVLVLDVTEAEAEKVLVTLDPLAAMAGTDERMLSELVARIETDSAAVKEELAKLASTVMTVATEPEVAADELAKQKETLEAFIAARQASTARGDDKAEQNFWVCLVFQSWQQKQEFLFAIKDIPVLYGMYADGQTLAESIGIKVTPNTQREFTSPLDKKLSALVTVD